jgi:hypothetical protein
MSAMEAKFTAMQTEWLAVRTHLHTTVTQWEQRLAALAQEEARLRDDGRWIHGRDDFLGVPDAKCLSSMVASISWWKRPDSTSLLKTKLMQRRVKNSAPVRSEPDIAITRSNGRSRGAT